MVYNFPFPLPSLKTSFVRLLDMPQKSYLKVLQAAKLVGMLFEKANTEIQTNGDTYRLVPNLALIVFPQLRGMMIKHLNQVMFNQASEQK